VSSVTEVTMGDGSFTINLDPSTPRSIVEELQAFSTVCVVPGRETGLSRSEVLGLASYSGILRSRTDNSCTLMGPSILAWLGDEDDKGPQVSGTYSASTSPQDLLTDIFADLNTNGITLGSISGLPATAYAYVGWTTGYPYHTLRWYFDLWHRVLGWDYRVNPDGTFDMASDGSLFTSTPTMLVVPTWLAEAPTDVSYRCVAGRINNLASDDNYVTVLSLVPSDENYVGTATVGSGTGPHNFANAEWGSWGRDVDTSQLFTSFTDSNAAADVELLANWSTENRVDIAVPLDDPKAHVAPGDSIYVYDPLQGLQLPGVTEIDALGQPMFPIIVDVQQMTWPVCDGMGVYVIQNDSAEVVDLTDYVLFGRGDTTLQVGARWPSLGEFVMGRN
jgi:hypothetical protein